MAIPASRVLINDLENKEELYAVLQEELRKSGIKYRKEKSSKACNEKTKCKRIFKVPLHALELTDVMLASGGIVQIPLFVSNACQFILENVDMEGLFRKAGSTKRQQQIKAGLETGIPLGKTHHVIDVANIIKTFFRDLPEPLLPAGNVQEALIRCLLGGSDDKVDKLMMTCLLLPPITLNTLAYFMQFLQTVSKHAEKNRMTAENLAIILTPSIMPTTELVQQRFNSHVKVLQLLIENSQQIGLIPDAILYQLKDDAGGINVSTATNSVADKKKKKRRSGSLTRMFNGFKKMVSAIGSSENLDKTDEKCETDQTLVIGTPCLSKSAKKRKVAEGIAFSAKKKKEVTSLLPDNHDLLPCTPLVIKEPKKSRLSLGGSKKPSKVVQRLLPTGSIPSIAEGKPMERRWSVVGAPWGRKKQNRSKLQETSTNKTDPTSDTKTEDEFEAKPVRKSLLLTSGGRMSPVVSMPCLVSAEGLSSMAEQNDADETDAGDDFLKIRRSEYEAIKKRMSDIESKLSKEMTALVGREDVLLDNVEDKYRQTLEQTEPIEATCATTDQLAKRLSRELKIRRSGEHKVIRSPSARKIGTIRRRSREAVRLSRNQSWHVGNGVRDVPAAPVTTGTVDLSFYPKCGVLKRGRPNTVQSGLKAPDTATTSCHETTAVSMATEKQTTQPPSSPCVAATSLSGGNYTDEEKEEQWVNAESYFETHNVTDENASSVMDSTSEFLTPCKVLMEDYFKTPDKNARRASLRSASKQQQQQPGSAFCTPTQLVSKIDVNIHQGAAKTPMLPPVVPPRIKTPARTPKLPPRTPSSLLKSHITPLQEAQSGRASIARIRSQNAGMVMAKAKLFDGLVTNAGLDVLPAAGGTSSKRTPISNRRQSAKFRTAMVAAAAPPIVTSSDAGSAAQIRQIQKLRSSSAHYHGSIRSPRKSTPRKRAFTRSAHGGGINRREKLRQATKGGSAATSMVGIPSKALLNSPRTIRRLQENVHEHLAAVNVNVVCLSPNLKDMNSSRSVTTTPHIRKQLLRNSPRRILAATPGRDNRMPHGGGGGERYQTPLKATPLSRFAISTAPGFENSPERTSHPRAANVR